MFHIQYNTINDLDNAELFVPYQAIESYIPKEYRKEKEVIYDSLIVRTVGIRVPGHDNSYYMRKPYIVYDADDNKNIYKVRFFLPIVKTEETGEVFKIEKPKEYTARFARQMMNDFVEMENDKFRRKYLLSGYRGSIPEKIKKVMQIAGLPLKQRQNSQDIKSVVVKTYSWGNDQFTMVFAVYRKKEQENATADECKLILCSTNVLLDGIVHRLKEILPVDGQYTFFVPVNALLLFYLRKEYDRSRFSIDPTAPLMVLDLLNKDPYEARIKAVKTAVRNLYCGKNSKTIFSGDIINGFSAYMDLYLARIAGLSLTKLNKQYDAIKAFIKSCFETAMFADNVDIAEYPKGIDRVIEKTLRKLSPKHLPSDRNEKCLPSDHSEYSRQWKEARIKFAITVSFYSTFETDMVALGESFSKGADAGTFTALSEPFYTLPNDCYRTNHGFVTDEEYFAFNRSLSDFRLKNYKVELFECIDSNHKSKGSIHCYCSQNGSYTVDVNCIAEQVKIIENGTKRKPEDYEKAARNVRIKTGDAFILPYTIDVDGAPIVLYEEIERDYRSSLAELESLTPFSISKKDKNQKMEEGSKMTYFEDEHDAIHTGEYFVITYNYENKTTKYRIIRDYPDEWYNICFEQFYSAWKNMHNRIAEKITEAVLAKFESQTDSE